MDHLREGEARERHTCVREGERRENTEGHPRMKGMLEITQGGGAARPRILPPGERNEHRNGYPGERGVNARLQHGDPERRPEEDVRRPPRHAKPVQHEEDREQDPGGEKRRRGQLARVEDGDDGNRPYIVEDRDAEEEGLEGRRDAVAEEGENTEGEGDIGRRRDRPPGHRARISPVEERIERGRHEHSTGGGKRGEGRGRAARQVPLEHLPLELEPDQQEEDGHQAVVDPEEERLGEAGGPDPDLHLEFEERRVKPLERGIRDDQAEHGRDHEDDPAGSLQTEELREWSHGGTRHDAGLPAGLGSLHQMTLRIPAPIPPLPHDRQLRQSNTGGPGAGLPPGGYPCPRHRRHCTYNVNINRHCV